MQSKAVKITTLLSILLLAAQTQVNATQRITIGSVGFATPESVEYYADGDIYLVSNINGHPAEKDGNGFISTLSPAGEVLELKWIDGAEPDTNLNAPKGMAITGDILYVADLDEVHLFELPGGRQLASVKIQGATFLNGITPNPAGGVFVTDSGLQAGEGGLVPSGTDGVYEVTANGRYRALIRDSEMGRPNGIVFADGWKVIVSFGTGSVIGYRDSGGNRTFPAPATGALDGLLQMEDGSYLLSSWEGASIYRLDRDGNYQIIASQLESPADIGYDGKRQRILVPLFLKDEVSIIPYNQ